MIRAALALGLAVAAPAFGCTVPPWLSAMPGSDVVVDTRDPNAIARAWYGDLSDIYGHGILGDALEPTTLHVWSSQTSASCGVTVSAGQGHVFEDIAPRIADVTGDGRPEVIAIRSSTELGGQVVVYGLEGDTLSIVAQTPYIGRRNRWLAPAAIADLDDDGAVEVAFIDRPHLAKVLRIWRYDNGSFREIAAAEGLTNHRIGEAFISGGLRTCGEQPQIVLASANWTRLHLVSFDGASITAEDAGPWSTQAAREALSCVK